MSLFPLEEPLNSLRERAARDHKDAAGGVHARFVIATHPGDADMRVVNESLGCGPSAIDTISGAIPCEQGIYQGIFRKLPLSKRHHRPARVRSPVWNTSFHVSAERRFNLCVM
jgi:hypothetical protein